MKIQKEVFEISLLLFPLSNWRWIGHWTSSDVPGVFRVFRIQNEASACVQVLVTALWLLFVFLQNLLNAPGTGHGFLQILLASQRDGRSTGALRAWLCSCRL